MSLTETLNTFLTDFGVSVSFSGSTAGMLGIEDAPGDLELSSILGIQQGNRLPGVVGTDRTLLIRTDQKGSLDTGSTITVNAVSRTVRYLLSSEDGAFTLVFLR